MSLYRDVEAVELSKRKFLKYSLVIGSLLNSLKFRLSFSSVQLNKFQRADPRKTNEALINLLLHRGIKATFSSRNQPIRGRAKTNRDALTHISRASYRIHEIASSSDYFTCLPVCFVIGQSYYFCFRSSKLNRKSHN